MKPLNASTKIRVFLFAMSFLAISNNNIYSQCDWHELYCGDYTGGSSYYFNTIGGGNDFNLNDYTNCYNGSSNFDAEDLLFRYEKYDYKTSYITIFNEGNVDLDLFRIDDCEGGNILPNLIGCQDASIEGYGSIDFNYNIDYLSVSSPGVYWFVVDGWTSSEVGHFTLSLSCDEFWDCEVEREIYCGIPEYHSTCPPSGFLYSSDKISKYGCNDYPYYTGWENVHKFTATQSGPHTFLATELNDDLDMYILDNSSCYNMSGSDCIGGSAFIGTADEMSTIDLTSGQTVYVVLDGYLDACSAYRLSVECATFDCDLAYDLYCDDVLYDSNNPNNDLYPTTPISNAIHNHDHCSIPHDGCEELLTYHDYSNPEVLYRVTNNSNQVGSYPNYICIDMIPYFGQDADIYCYQDCHNGQLTNCVGGSVRHGDLAEGIIFEDLNINDAVYTIVDSKDGHNNVGDFKISVTCGNLCNKEVTPVVCGKAIHGALTDEDGNFNSHYCCAETYPVVSNYISVVGCTGPEDIYSFEVQENNQEVSITLTERNGSKNLQLFLMSDCYYKECLFGAISENGNEIITTTLNPGTYLVVVDGYDEAKGDYTLTVNGCKDFLGEICEVMTPIYTEDFESFTVNGSISNQDATWISSSTNDAIIVDNNTLLKSKTMSLKGMSGSSKLLVNHINHPAYKLEYECEVFYKPGTNTNELPDAEFGIIDDVLPDFVKSLFIRFSDDNHARLYFATAGLFGQNDEFVKDLGDIFTKGSKVNSNKFRITWIIDLDDKITLYINGSSIASYDQEFPFESLSIFFSNMTLGGYIDYDEICLAACHKNKDYSCTNAEILKCESFDNYSNNTPINLVPGWSDGGKGVACNVVNQGVANKALAIRTIGGAECGAEYTIVDNSLNNSIIELSYDILIPSGAGGGLQSLIETDDPANQIFFNFINDELNYMIGDYYFSDYTKVDIDLDTYFTFRLQLNKSNGNIKVYLGDKLLNEIGKTDYRKLTKVYFDSALSANNKITYIDNVCLSKCEDCQDNNLPHHSPDNICSAIKCLSVVPLNEETTSYTFINESLPSGGEWMIIEIDPDNNESIVAEGLTEQMISYNCITGKRYYICYRYLGTDGCYQSCCFKLDLSIGCASIGSKFIGDESNNTFEYSIDNLSNQDSIAGWFIAGSNIGIQTSVVYSHANTGEYYVCCLVYNRLTKCYRICCKRYCIENPLNCNDISVSENSGIYTLQIDGASEIVSWTIDDPIVSNNYIGNNNPQIFNPSNFGINTAQTILISVSYYDHDGCAKTCCKRIPINPNNGSSLIITLGDICIHPGQASAIPVTVKNFDEIAAFGCRINLPAGGNLRFDNIANATLSNVNFNIVSDTDIIIGWDDLNGNFINLDDDTRIFDILIYANPDFDAEVTTSTIEKSVLGNTISTIMLESSTICLAQSQIAKGKIANEVNKPHGGVKVELSANAMLQNTTTLGDGSYQFDINSASGKIEPYKNDEVRKGISIVDVARIRRHNLQLALLDSDYKMVAGDANMDGKIDIVDAAIVNRIFLQKITSFPNNTSWRFLPKHLDISTNPLSVAWPNIIDLSIAGLDYNALDFISIKVGDVDNSALSFGHQYTEGSRSVDIICSIPDTVVSQSDIIALPISVSEFNDVSILSFEVLYDKELLTFEGISGSQLKGFSSGSYNDIGGKIIVGWDHPEGNAQSINGDLMYLNFKPKEEVVAKSNIEIISEQALDVDFNQLGISTNAGSIEVITTGVLEQDFNILINSYPNPFTDILFIECQLVRPQSINVELSTPDGKLIKNTFVSNKQMHHKLAFDDIDYRGVIICKLTSMDQEITFKVIKI